MKNLLLMLLAFFGIIGVSWAQDTDTCPKAPKNLLCFVALRNTCTNDSNCEPGTRCCFDGCRRRCKDPSLFSRGARQEAPRKGVCPVLSPPFHFCPSDFDECMFDWDCDGSTKKCCYNGCYKVCAEPGIQGTEDKCPAPTKLPRCHFGQRNQCLNNSMCGYLENGLCCFDGCRRRCATPEGFETTLETERPGRCPFLPYPQFCIADAGECLFDGDCFPGQKCCTNNCFKRCVDPVDEQGAIGGISAQSNNCPVPSTSQYCHIGLTHACNKDKECDPGKFCCFDGCRRTCYDPNKKDAPASDGLKNGSCPSLPVPEYCVSDVDECFRDYDCPGIQKCCSNDCYKLCASPDEVSVAAAVKCPEPVVQSCPAFFSSSCEDSTDCTMSDTVCCFDGCRRRCIPPKGTPDSCPKPPVNMLCSTELRNRCVDDSSCRPGTLCCYDGCRRRCRDPSNFNRGAEEADPRPGICPVLAPPTEFCPLDYNECQFDWDCEGTTKKCCSNTCYKVCVEPRAGAIEDQCPSPPDTEKLCHMGLLNICTKASDCDYLEGGLCCYDGCRRRCATPEGFAPRLETPRPGKCPFLPEPEFCVDHADECELDGDCYPGKKCCSNNCFNSCVDPDNSLFDPPTEGKCPITSNTTGCHMGLGHVCNNDEECPNETNCCFDGCRRKCIDTKTGQGSIDGVAKNGSCPALPVPDPCVAEESECEFDWDCAYDRKCCYNGCFKVCVPSIEDNVSPENCPNAKPYHCSRTLKHSCDNSSDCRSGFLCCFDGCRRRCVKPSPAVGEQSERITVSCRKDEMQVDVERDALDGFRSVFLRLKNASCNAAENATHFSLVAPLMYCGTTSRHTEDSVVYSNEVREHEASFEGIVTRMQELSIPFSCYYTKEGTTSTLGLIPNKIKMTMDGGDIITEFVLEMSVFKDPQYLLPFGAVDFPIKVSLNKPLYVQLAVDSPDTRLTIKEQNCYATPTQNPNDKMKYYIIRDGCIVDSTVTYYSSSNGVRRFSFDTFQFTGNNGNFVYLHCDLVVCNASSAFSRCSVGCLVYPRKRRELEEPGVSKAALTEGPFVLAKEGVAKRTSNVEESSSIDLNTWLVIAMAAFCALCLAIIVYMKVKPTPKPTADPDRETYI